MKSVIKVLLSLFVFAFLASCINSISSTGESFDTTAEDLIVYGSPTCGITTGLRDDLDMEGIPYTFKDVENDVEANQELYQKLQHTSWYDGGTVAIPIVDVKGTMLLQPTVDEVEAYL